MWKYTLETNLYVIEITGGSVRIISKNTNTLVKEHKGYTYLYTGAVHPKDTEFFALENGKRFYVYSLKDFELKKRITLPKTYESIDVYGFYSDDGQTITIPAERYVYDDTTAELGHYEFVLLKYSSDTYELIDKTPITDNKQYHWKINKKN